MKKKTHPFTPQKLRLAVGQTGEEKAVSWNMYAEAQEEMQEYFSLGCEPPGVCHLPVMDGHTGWKMELYAIQTALFIFQLS